jgi:hypothetical protein
MPGPRHATVQAWGAFKATGHFIRQTATITFPKGRIMVRRHVQKITYSGPNLQTCRFTIVERGTFSVKKATGKYRGLHETGHFTSKVARTAQEDRDQPVQFQDRGQTHRDLRDRPRELI